MADKQKLGKVEQQIEPEGKDIKHAWFWPKMGEWFADTGKPNFPI